MDAKELKVGDVVTLKSGGPDMTVSRAGHSAVECIWFDHDYKCQNGDFPPICLNLVNTTGEDEPVVPDGYQGPSTALASLTVEQLDKAYDTMRHSAPGLTYDFHLGTVGLTREQIDAELTARGCPPIPF